MIERVDAVWSNRNKVDELVRSNRTYQWFRQTGRLVHRMTVLVHSGSVHSFVLDDTRIWRRFASEGDKERFESEGNVVISGLFDWIVKDAELIGMASAEFEMYRHHLREQNGKQNLGWCRNMWHSLVQQVIR